MKPLLEKLFNQETLSRLEAEAVMHHFLEGTAGPESIAATLGALASRGLTNEEWLGLATEARRAAHSLPVSEALRAQLLDTCGTGGDGASTFNISTAASLVIAGAGVPVAKHGNRAVSSRAGSADVLEALGVGVDQSPEQAALSLETVGYAFLFAPRYHPGFRHVSSVRRALGVRTFFNMLGPLLNPARVTRQLIGVSDPRWMQPVARLAQGLGHDCVWVVRGTDGLDEMSTAAPTELLCYENGQWRTELLDALDWGLSRPQAGDLSGGDAAFNASLIEQILRGEQGPRRDVVLWNAAAGLRVSNKAQDFPSALEQARASLDSGAAHRILESLRAFKRSHQGEQ